MSELRISIDKFFKNDLNISSISIEYINKLIESHPKNPNFYFLRGYKKYYESDLENLAINDFSKAIKLDPNYSKAYFYRGIINFYNLNYKKAIKDFNKTAELEELKANNKKFMHKIYHNIGVTKACLGDYEGTIKEFTKIQNIKK